MFFGLLQSLNILLDFYCAFIRTTLLLPVIRRSREGRFKKLSIAAVGLCLITPDISIKACHLPTLLLATISFISGHQINHLTTIVYRQYIMCSFTDMLFGRCSICHKMPPPQIAFLSCIDVGCNRCQSGIQYHRLPYLYLVTSKFNRCQTLQFGPLGECHSSLNNLVTLFNTCCMRPLTSLLYLPWSKLNRSSIQPSTLCLLCPRRHSSTFITRFHNSGYQAPHLF